MRQPLGQHFLRDPQVLQAILTAAALSKEETVLEIGPGKGILTHTLRPHVQNLIAVELDRLLAARLTKQFSNDASVRIVQGDFLKQDLNALVPEASRPIKILGNLPYLITSLIFEKILAWPYWDSGVFLIQKEVAERMQSPEGSRTFGILSLAVQLFATVELLRTVPPTAFEPPPKVFSAVIRLQRKKDPTLPEEDLPAFFDLVHGAFAHRRKTIANSLAFHANADKKRIENWLQEHAISPADRAEMLSLETYARLTAPWRIFRRETSI